MSQHRVSLLSRQGSERVGSLGLAGRHVLPRGGKEWRNCKECHPPACERANSWCMHLQEWAVGSSADP